MINDGQEFSPAGLNPLNPASRYSGLNRRVSYTLPASRYSGLHLCLFTRCAENAARFGIRYRNQFSFPSLVPDPGRKGIIGNLNHSSSCAIFIQDKNAATPNENPCYKTRDKVAAHIWLNLLCVS